MRLGKIAIFSLMAALMFSACGGNKGDTETPDKDTNNTTVNTSTSITLQSLRLETDLSTTAPLIRYSGAVRGKVRAIATYSDGHSEEVTDFANFSRMTETVDGKTYVKISVSSVDHLLIYREGDFPLSASLDGIESNVLHFTTVNETRPIRVKIRNNDKLSIGLGRSASVDVTLLQKPTADMNVNMHLDPNDQIKSRYGNTLVFKADEWDSHGRTQTLQLDDLDINNTDDFTITFDPIVSDDPHYNGYVIPALRVHKDVTPKLISPTVSQLRGAIRGNTIKFRVTSKEFRLEYTLVNPPEGMRILGKSDMGEGAEVEGVDLEWKVPLDMQEGRHLVTVQAKDIEGKTGEITFEITVPKTTPIQTEIKNNELIVTDTSSRLYGMKMKGHNGEDISSMRLESVDYRQLWRKRIKLDAGDVPEYVPFVIYNKPPQLDIDFPEYSNDVYTYFFRHGDVLNEFWKDIDKTYYKDDAGSYVPIRNEYDSGGTQVYLLIFNKKANI